MPKVKPRKHKIWITLTDRAFQLLVIEQKRLAATSAARITPSVVIDQLIVNCLLGETTPLEVPHPHHSRVVRRAAAGAAAEPLGEARRGKIE